MIVALLVLLLLVGVITLVFAWKAMAARNNTDWMAMKYKMESVMNEIARIEAAVKQEMVTNRQETGDNTQRIRVELAASLKNFGELITQTMSSASTVQKDSFHALLNKQSEQNNAIAFRLDQMRETLEKKMAEMQTGNERKLDEMRATVDEKLQKTLETRLGESFKLVSERLEAVHKGLGDMQQLATGVGDLKRVLTNVKSRGVLGEYQLESILEQILTIDQYGRNVKTKEGSNALVEFAIKLPGRGDKDKAVWLPVDSKFPKEDFEALMDAYDQAMPDLVEEIRKNFIKGIRKCALDISSKYVDPPNTTDFAILFSPLRKPVCRSVAYARFI